MGRKKSKKNYMPIGFCGSFFPIDFLKELKDIVLEEESSKISIEDFMNVFIGGFEFKDFPYMKENCFLLINEKHIYDYDENEDDEPGYFIGVNIFDLPEHLSIKRIKIDVRTMLQQLGLINEEEDSDVVQIMSTILEI